eukprot:11257958-Ditylum_brightwellii.AAC.1
MMGISVDDIPDMKIQSKEREHFIGGMGYEFPIELYSFSYGGRTSDYHTKILLIKKATGIKDRLAKQLYSTILLDGTAPIGIADNEDEEFEISKFTLFWEAAKRVLEMENGSGAHSHHHAGADMKSNTNVSVAPMIASVLQLIKK